MITFLSHRPASHAIDGQDMVYTLAGTPTALYMGCASGLYRSIDGGQTWHTALASLALAEPLAVTALAVEDDLILAGVYGAILRSEDSGQQWHTALLASPPPVVTSIIRLAGDDWLASTTQDGVFVSNDAGRTWTPWNFGLLDQHVYALAAASRHFADQGALAATESGLFYTHNKGRSWVALDFPMDAAPVICVACLALPDKAARWLAGTETHGLWSSDDAGATWQRCAATLMPEAVNALRITDDAAPVIWALLADQVVYSPDGGQHWDGLDQALPADKTASALWVQLLSANGRLMVIGLAEGEIGVYRLP